MFLAVSLFGLPVELVCAAISLVGVVISTAISYLTARHHAKAELKKLDHQWQREDNESFSSDLHNCCRCVQNYLDNPTSKDRHRIALRNVQLLRSTAPDSLVSILRKLHAAIEQNNITEASDLLDRLIDAGRKANR